jgi:Phage tail assembly chaperone proteins, E, or 41 or 14
MSVTIPLTRPIEAHGKTLTELTLQEPRGRDIAACGLPRTFTRKGDTSTMVTDAGAIHAYIVRLGNIPPPSADALCASDWMDVMGAILGFFAPAAPGPAAAAVAGTALPAAAAAPAGIEIPFQGSTT